MAEICCTGKIQVGCPAPAFFLLVQAGIAGAARQEGYMRVYLPISGA